MKWLLNNIHTILLVAGLGLITYSSFLFNVILGYFVCGILLVILAVVINSSASNRK